MHGHHHHDHGDHSHSHSLIVKREPGDAANRASERRKLALTIVVTTAILIAEVVGGFLSHSLALLSDAGHMLSDVVAMVLSLVALVLATRPADARRTYGWYRLEILAALLNGLTLIALSGGVIWAGIHRLGAPAEIHTRMMMIIAGIGLAANLVGAYLLHDAKSLNAKGAYLHILGDTLSSVAVLIGGAIMFALHGAYWLDPVLSMVIGLFILYSSYSLVREAVDVLLETVPRDVDLAGVSAAIGGIEGVSEVHDLHIWTITSGMYALSAHIVVAAGHAEHNDVLLNKVKDVLMQRFKISHTTLQLESVEYEHVGHVC
jgi:cobalt-zinc-cadmium efflux system protein